MKFLKFVYATRKSVCTSKGSEIQRFSVLA